MKATLYHNPRCSKSRETLALLEQAAIDFEIVEYRKTPLSLPELQLLCQKLDGSPSTLVRTSDSLFKELADPPTESSPDGEWLQLLVKQPALMQRPVVVYRDKAVMGRPPSKVREWLDC